MPSFVGSRLGCLQVILLEHSMLKNMLSVLSSPVAHSLRKRNHGEGDEDARGDALAFSVHNPTLTLASSGTYLRWID